MRKLLLALSLVPFVLTGAARADVDSGPAVGNPVPEVKVSAVTGESAGQDDLDYAAHRAEKPTVWVFVPKAKWDRPMARLVKTLDEKIAAANAEAQVVAVWLTDDPFATKDYLPKAQMSLKLEHTALTYFPRDPVHLGDWGINPDADVTVVVSAAGKIVKAWGFTSPNDTLARQVLAEIAPKSE